LKGDIELKFFKLTKVLLSGEEQHTALYKNFFAGETGLDMRCAGRTLGIAALTFGAGVLMCALLPAGVLVCIQAALILTAGVLLFVR